ncbi:MAG: dihydrofolate synthase/folylpolyglutamate synthase [Flavobacterium sp.]|jgi:dihydrofolate synthase/folylpolyglutamate synthase
MNYEETIQWMFQQLPMYQTQGAMAYKEDLSNTILLSNHLGNPEKNQVFIHVAGTNGKGSTSHMLASILQEAGYKVGLYTSPHLKDFRERIKINGKEISKEFVQLFISDNKDFFAKNELSFFEMTVGLAFQYFKQEITDVNIIEVGMGGRLDSTNIITPILSIITNIGLDHTQFLGNTLAKIAFEKAGIIKVSIPVVIGEFTMETKPIFEEISKSKQSEIYFASNTITEIYSSDLQGDYQENNKKTVIQSLKLLNGKFNISDNNIKQGFLNVANNTGFKGRWQVIGINPKIICDTGHNAHGLKIVLNQLKKESFERLHVVIGMVNDKDITTLLPLFPSNATYYFCKPNNFRGLNSEVLKANAKLYNLFGNSYPTVNEALSAARTSANSRDCIFVGGSTFVVAEIL